MLKRSLILASAACIFALAGCSGNVTHNASNEVSQQSNSSMESPAQSNESMENSSLAESNGSSEDNEGLEAQGDESNEAAEEDEYSSDVYDCVYYAIDLSQLPEGSTVSFSSSVDSGSKELWAGYDAVVSDGKGNEEFSVEIFGKTWGPQGDMLSAKLGAVNVEDVGTGNVYVTAPNYEIDDTAYSYDPQDLIDDGVVYLL